MIWFILSTYHEFHRMECAVPTFDNMNFSVHRALSLYDQGDYEGAVRSFQNDMSKEPETAWVAAHPLLGSTLNNALGSRDEFEAAMRGFKI